MHTYNVYLYTVCVCVYIYIYIYNVYMVCAESPLQFYVNQASTPSVTAFGPGLVYGTANKVAAFTICTQDAAEGTFILL